MALKTEPLIVNFGPQHPSTHGVFRMRVTFDGEEIKALEPFFGYLHRGTEKLCEGRSYTQNITFTDRLDYLSAMSNNLAYCLGAEKLADVPVPERAQYIRVIMAEFQRIASHLAGIGFWINDLGAFYTPMVYTFREREKILDLFEMVSGQRLTPSYIRIGGVAEDLPLAWLPAARKLIGELPGYFREYEDLLFTNEIILARTKGVGILPADLLINASVTGPMLRASGVKWDLRKDDPYSIYDRFDFDVPVQYGCDSYDRFVQRMQEMWQSLRILEQALDQIPDGPIRSDVPLYYRPPAGEAYGHIEAPKGELGFYFVSDGGIAPYRVKIRAPSYINLTVLEEAVRGWKLPDLIAIFGSFDIVMGEVDR